MLFGGLGGNTGTIVKYNFAWDSVAPDTSHTVVQAPSPGFCPTTIPGSRGTDGKVINWTLTGADRYAIYRSVNGSGAGNSGSNGRYDLVTTVSGTTTTFTDTDNACKSTGSGCWHIVVPLNATNQISGCHGEESSTTAVTLHTFRSADPAVNWPLVAGVGALAAVLIGGLAVSRRRAATH